MTTQQNYSNVMSPATSPASDAMMRGTVSRLFDEFEGNTAGALADYIPELAKVAPNQFGIALTSNQGRTVWTGDASVSFTIQSISKALTFAMLLERAGREETYRYVGVQPMAEPFNAITLNPQSNRPFNPMVNTGAIAVAGRLRQVLGPNAFDEVLEVFGRAAGRTLDVDERSSSPSAKPATATAPSAICCAPWGCSTCRWMRCWISISANARSGSPRSTCPSWARPWPTWASIR